MLVFLKELFFLSQHNAFYITKCFCLSTRSFVYQHTVFTPQNVPIQSNPSVLWSTVSFSLFSTRMYAFQSCFSKQSYRKAKSIRWSANSCHMATLQSFVSKQSYLKAKSFIWSANSCHMATLQSFFFQAKLSKGKPNWPILLVLTNVVHVYPDKGYKV